MSLQKLWEKYRQETVFVWRISLIHRFTAASEITFVFSSASDESKESNTLRVFRKVSPLTVP